jgi:hypothetical protein
MNDHATKRCSSCDSAISAEEVLCTNCGAPTLGGARPTAPGTEAEEVDLNGPDGVEGGSPEPSPGLVLDWEPELVDMVERAAGREGLTREEFIRAVVEREARRALKPPQTKMSLDQTANALGVTRTDVIRKITAGKLKAKKVGDEWMVLMDGAPEKQEDPLKRIQRELEALIETAGLTGLKSDGDLPDTVSSTWCFVNRERQLVCPTEAWRRYGRNRVMAEARDAIKRFRKSRDRELGIL